MSRWLAGTLEAPRLYLSSNQAGWEGLQAEAFYEPRQHHGLKRQASPDVTLIFFDGGPLQLEQRYENGQRATVVVREGDFVLRTGEPYEVGWESLSATPSRTLHLHLNGSLLLRSAEQLGGCNPARILWSGRDAGFQDALLRAIALTLWRELEQSTPAGNLYAQTAAQMLAVHLLRYHTAASIRIREISHILTPRQLKRITEYVMGNLSEDISLEALADQVGLSAYHFARLFRRTTGESPHQFVVGRRIENARYLLRETSEPLAAVAVVCGFANQSHMTRIFKRRLGFTPKVYRDESQFVAHSCNAEQE